MKIFVKILIAVLLLLCLADMPYGYYVLVRYVAAFAFAYFALEYYKAKKNELVFLFGALAILFQPFVKLALGRIIWNVIDVIVAIGLIYIVIIDYRRNRK